MQDIDPDSNFFNSYYASIDIDRQSLYYSVDELNSVEGDSSDLSLINYNIRSFNHNIDDFASMLDSLKFDFQVIVLSETWLKDDSVTSNLLNYNGYHTPHIRGGVSIYCRTDIEAGVILSGCTVNIHFCVVKLRCNNVGVSIVAVYRPHSGTTDGFVLELFELLNNDCLVNVCPIIVIGDLNINLLSDSNVSTDFMNNMMSMNYLPVITKPTRFPVGEQRGAPSLIDHIWCNKLTNYRSGIITCDITDHLPSFITFLDTNQQQEKTRVIFRDHSQNYIDRFVQLISRADWSVDTSKGVDVSTECFVKKLDDFYCNVFPLKVKYLSNKRLCKPWLTSGLLQSIKTKSRYFKLWKLNMVSDEYYRNYRNKLTTILRVSKQKFYESRFTRSRNNIKLTWNVINGLLNRNKNRNGIESIILREETITDKTIIARAFNDYFSSIATDLDRQLPQCNIDPAFYVKKSSRDSIFLRPVNRREVERIIMKLKNSTFGCHSIPTFLVKLVCQVVSTPLSELINCSFAAGQFPTVLKNATITPIHKSGPTDQLNNFRPISVLPLFSKIFEKCYAERLMNFLTKHNLITKSQFGFLGGKSTVDAVLNWSRGVYSAINDGEHALGIFIDMKKAFDTVSHEVLLRKARRYGVRGVAHDWLSSYLCDRKHRVKVGDKFSEYRTVNIGVPQGGVVSTLLFLLYINDLPECNTGADFTIFADDSTLSLHNDSYERLLGQARDVLLSLQGWALSNRLTLHPEKTVALLITNRVKDLILPAQITLNDVPVTFVDSVKFLGIFFDNKLSFSYHIKHICNKISKSIGILYQVSRYAETPVLTTLYYSLIYPYLIYGNIVWGGTAMTHLDSLIKLQKKAIRLITGSHYLAHTSDLFRQTRILPLQKINTYLIAIHMYKLHRAGQLSFPTHDYNTRYRGNTTPIFQRLTLTQRCISYRGPVIWNSIPFQLKSCNTLSRFKFGLKDYLLSLN